MIIKGLLSGFCQKQDRFTGIFSTQKIRTIPGGERPYHFFCYIILIPAPVWFLRFLFSLKEIRNFQGFLFYSPKDIRRLLYTLGRSCGGLAVCIHLGNRYSRLRLQTL